MTTGGASNAISAPIGSIDVVDGYEARPANGADVLNDQHLLYMLIVVPGLQQHSSSSGSDNGTYVTTLFYGWNTDAGSFNISIPWNRQTDTVTIGKQEFIRGQGNVFLVRINAKGKIYGRQFASLGGHSRFQDVLNYVQQQLPDDDLISSATLDH